MKKQITWLIIFIAFLLLIAWIVFENSHLEINEWHVASQKLPEAFDGFRIVQISDLHNAEFGKNNEKLLSLLKQADADIIVMTGDLIDSRKTDLEAALSFAKEAALIAPTYYANGNHEARETVYEQLKQGLLDCGVAVLENKRTDLTIGSSTIHLIGMNDPAFAGQYTDAGMKQTVENQLSEIVPDNNRYKILLAHRPEYFSIYAQHVDLAFCGHAHGGQFILPFIGGLAAPGQGLLPEYYSGLYEKNGAHMIVSRGIGNSIIPFRINNNPEIVVAELTCISD